MLKRKRVYRILKWVLIVYATIGFIFYFFQERFLFRSEALDKDYHYSFAIPFRELNLHYDSVSNISIVQFKLKDTARPKGVVLYFHGNKRNINRYAQFAPQFTKHGYEVWMLDYPGYGKSTGEFTEAMIYEYAEQLYKLARASFAKESITIYGKSMGTGIASYIASKRDCKQLILETPYYSLPELANSFLPIYPWNMMLRYEFPTYKYLPKVEVPVTIFHGTSDDVIPPGNARKLSALLKPADHFVSVEGGSHNDLYQFPLTLQKLDSILSK